MKRIITLFFIITSAVGLLSAQEPEAIVKSVWIEHNVTHTFTSSQAFWNGFTWVNMPQNIAYKGMKIHVDFDVNYAPRQKTWVCVFVFDEDGDPVSSSTNRFRSPDGTLTVQYPVNPQYEYTTFDDLWLFIPYSEINVKSVRGETISLKLKVYIMDSTGYVLDSSDWEHFNFTK